MKTKILVLSALTFSLALSFIACKKEKDDTSNNDEVAIHSDDQSRFASEIDAAANDADLTIESSSNFTGRYQGVQGVICDASVVVNTSGDPKTITITYDGTNCAGNRKRTGSIVISMAQNVQWKNAGASVMVNFQNLKITRVSDNKSITINGSQTYTNVSGDLL